MRISRDFQDVLTVFTVSLMIGAAVAWVSLNPPAKEDFFALGILGENQTVDRYYPGRDQNIPVGVDVKWYLMVFNRMGIAQYVAVRAKLLNSTLQPPDDASRTPSPQPYFYEARRLLIDNETWVFPFTWRLTTVETTGGSLVVKALAVNNEPPVAGLNVSAVSGFNFRMVFELWFSDPTAGGFRFDWSLGGLHRSAWGQIWFNATLIR